MIGGPLPHRLALALLLAACALAVPDALGLIAGRWSHARVTSADGGLATVASRGGRQRYVNVYIGIAAREVAGGVPRRVVVPRDLELLGERPPDTFGDQEQAAIDRRLMSPLLGPGMETAAYDPRLSDAGIRRLRSLTRPRELEWGVVSLAVPGRPSRDVVLLADERGEHVYAAPLALAARALGLRPPAGGEAAP